MDDVRVLIGIFALVTLFAYVIVGSIIDTIRRIPRKKIPKTPLDPNAKVVDIYTKKVWNFTKQGPKTLVYVLFSDGFIYRTGYVFSFNQLDKIAPSIHSEAVMLQKLRKLPFHKRFIKTLIFLISK